MGLVLRTAILLLYPVLCAGVNFGWNSPQRFTTWGTASLIGLVVFAILMALLPSTLDMLELGPRIARPLGAYLGGLATTSAIVLITRRRANPSG